MMATLRDFNGQAKKETKLGGIRATLPVYAMEGLENMTFLSNVVSPVTYFYGYMNFNLTKSATTLTNFMGTSYLLALYSFSFGDQNSDMEQDSIK